MQPGRPPAQPPAPLTEETLMPLTFHWFLPTYGDSRDIVGGGHGVAAGAAGGARPPSIAYLGQIARSCRAARLRRGAHPDRRLVRGRLADHRDAQRGTERLKFLVAFRPGLDLTDAGRADGLDLPAALAAAGCCSTSSPAARSQEQRAVRRLPRQGRPLRPRRRVPRRGARRCGGARPSTSTASTCGSRARAGARAGAGAADLLRRVVAGGGAGGGPAQPTST